MIADGGDYEASSRMLILCVNEEWPNELFPSARPLVDDDVKHFFSKKRLAR